MQYTAIFNSNNLSLTQNIMPDNTSMNVSRLLFTLALFSYFIVIGCSRESSEIDRINKENTNNSHQSNLYNFNEKNIYKLAQKLASGTQKTRVVQLGDSHTAADFFTGHLREMLQKKYGNAGPGFILPTTIKGQRNATIKITENNARFWSLQSSRIDNNENFPIGGFILQATDKKNAITLSRYTPSTERYQLRTLYRSKVLGKLKSSQRSLELSAHTYWKFSDSVDVRLPITWQVTPSHQLDIAGWLIEQDSPGVMLSALGINGATINMLDKWNNAWLQQLQQLQPDLLILAYGTNEAFNDDLDITTYKNNLSHRIKNLRALLPNTVFLLIGPNSFIKNTTGMSCDTQQAKNLRPIIAAQKKAAEEQHTLFWDWQQFMGGDCAITHWASQDLANSDLIHLNRAGYEKSANALFYSLEFIMSKSRPTKVDKKPLSL